MEGMILVRLRDSGQTQFYAPPTNLEVKEGDYVIIEHDRGLDYGQIILRRMLYRMSSPKNR
jgi:cell fate regulator YaaT (PSP1 superfamily)